MILIFRKYFLFFILCCLLTSCGGSSEPTESVSMGFNLPKAVKSSYTTEITSTQRYNLVALTQVMFNAAPGAMILKEFEDFLANSGSISELANALESSDSFRSPQLYPLFLTNQQFAEKLVATAIGDMANVIKKGWLVNTVKQLLDDGATRGEVAWLLATALLEIPASDPDWGRAATRFTNRIEVAYHYSVILALSSADLGTLQAVTRYVTDDPATVIAAKDSKPVNQAPSWALLGITGESRQLTLNWTNNSINKGSAGSTYTIYWSKKPGVTKKTGSKITSATSPYTHSGLSNGTMYYYVVTETINGIEGSESMEVAAAPRGVLSPPPTSISISPQNRAVHLSIDRTDATTQTRYNLYWSKTSDLQGATKITNAFGSGNTFRHTGLTNGSIYYYAVSAEGAEGESPLSKSVAAVPMAEIKASNHQASGGLAQLAAPGTITAMAGSQLTTLSWNMPVFAIPTVFDQSNQPTQPPVITGYNIYWSEDIITDQAQAEKINIPAIDSNTASSFIHNTNLVNGKSYYYLITALADLDANGNRLKTADGRLLSFESPAGSQIMVTAEAKAPVAPTKLSAIAGAYQVNLSWTASSTPGAVYRLYVSEEMPVKPENLIKTENLAAITTITSFSYTGLQYGQAYYFVVTAATDAESMPSNMVAIMLQ